MFVLSVVFSILKLLALIIGCITLAYIAFYVIIIMAVFLGLSLGAGLASAINKAEIGKRK